jgi:hypothetical protein
MHPSKYSDWIAAGPLYRTFLVALARDGTLSLWRTPRSAPGILGPTRAPVTSINIFNEDKRR